MSGNFIELRHSARVMLLYAPFCSIIRPAAL